MTDREKENITPTHEKASIRIAADIFQRKALSFPKSDILRHEYLDLAKIARQTVKEFVRQDLAKKFQQRKKDKNKDTGT